jgi:hypothetical protein
VPDLSERIREYVDDIDPPVTLHDIEDVLRRYSYEPQQKPHRHFGYRRLAKCSALAAALIVIALFIEVLPTSGPEPSSEADAALTRVAAIAAAQPSTLVPKLGQYLYYQVTSRFDYITHEPAGTREFTFASTEVTDTWVATNGSGRQRSDTESPKLLVPSERAAWLASGSHPAGFLVGVTDEKFPTAHLVSGGPVVQEANGEYRLSYLDSAKFPTHPRPLEKFMKKYFRITGGATTTFLLAGDVLQIGASPALRSAIFHLIEHLQDVSYLGTTRDASGRAGIGVAIEGGGNRYVIVFNPKTSAVLGELTRTNRTTTHSGKIIPKGTLVGFQTYGTTGVTSSLTKFPDGKPAPAFHTQSPLSTGPIAFLGDSCGLQLNLCL